MQRFTNRNARVSAANSSGAHCGAFVSCHKVLEGHDPMELLYPRSACVPQELVENWSESAHIPLRRTIPSFILLIKELALATAAEAPLGKPG